MVGLNQEGHEYCTTVVILRESAKKIQFSTFAEISRQVVGDVLKAFYVFDNLPDEPKRADDSPDPIGSSVWNAGYSDEVRLEILASNSITYDPNDEDSHLIAYDSDDVESDGYYDPNDDDYDRGFNSDGENGRN